MDKPAFQGGVNIAIKIPKARYEQTLRFYRDVLGLALQQESPGCPTVQQSYSCQFGPNKLWLDMVEQYSQTDVWLELKTSDHDAAMTHLQGHGIAPQDELEQLPEGFKGHWIISPAGTVHLLHEAPISDE